MNRKPEDPLDLVELELAHLDVDPITAAAIRDRARAELARCAGPPSRTWPAGMRRAAGRAYRRLELPVASALAVAYLAWAVQTILAAG